MSAGIEKKAKYFIKYFWILPLIIIVTGCVHRKPVKLPPVVEGWQRSTAGKNAYIVQKKDTLYSIAWAFGLDYRELAKKNSLNPPYSLRCGQRIYIVSQQPTKNNYSPKTVLFTPERTNVQSLQGWIWPARGAVIKWFDDKLGGNRGIDIRSDYGSPVLASNSGSVVYSGTGIRSYGKLIIIKHNDDYLSAYAHNAVMLVREGQKVSVGQKIATMGSDDAGKVGLHFEIRRIGKPVNPLMYLPKKS
jgi:Membrane-bound metallopeptidase